MKKELNKILMFIGFIVTVVGAIICGVSNKANFALVFTIPNLAAVFALTLIFAKNETVKNTGYALAGLVGAYGVATIASENEDLMVAAVGMILMLVAAAIYFFVICLKFFGFVKDSEKRSVHSESGNLLATLEKYKEMQQEKVLSEEEFADLKQKVFAAVEHKAVSVEDLKKWKKLLDQKVITEEEFAQIKADIFNK